MKQDIKSDVDGTRKKGGINGVCDRENVWRKGGEVVVDMTDRKKENTSDSVSRIERYKGSILME